LGPARNDEEREGVVTPDIPEGFVEAPDDFNQTMRETRRRWAEAFADSLDNESRLIALIGFKKEPAPFYREVERLGGVVLCEPARSGGGVVGRKPRYWRLPLMRRLRRWLRRKPRPI
jgi:hypothetical protein